MIVTVDEIVESDSFQTQHGLLYGWKFVASDEQGNQHWLGINTKKPDGLEVGKTFDFLASGKTAGKWTLGKRADMNQQRPAQNRPVNAQGATQGHASGQGAAQVATRTPAPTVSDYGQEWASIFPRSHALMTRIAPEGVTPDTVFMAAKDFTTSVMIGLQRGDIRRDPSPEEIAAAAAAAQEAADAAAAEAQRLADEAAARARARIPQASAAPAGYAPAEYGSDTIPF